MTDVPLHRPVFSPQPATRFRPDSTSRQLVLALVGLLLLMVAGHALAEPVAVVVRASGEVERVDTDGTRSPLSRRDTVNIGDRIETGADARATLRFIDRGLVELGAGSRFVVARYQPDTEEDEDPNILIELIEGKLRTVTGALASDPNDYELITPNASIGIRGTEFEVWWQADSGTRARLTRGSISLVDRAKRGDSVLLTENSPFGAVAPGAAAVLLDEWTGTSLGPFSDAELGLDIPRLLPPLPPPLPPPPVPAIPMIVPLDADVAAVAAPDAPSEADSLTQFVQAVQGGDWPTARVLAKELLNRFEGTPRFDLSYALLLLHDDRTQEAIFALERVLAFAPDQHRARLELGRAYFVNNNLARSRLEFERVLASNPPANVRANIDAFLARITAAENAHNRQFNLFAALEAGWNSNINGGASLDGELDPNLFNLTRLADESQAVASGYGRFRFGANWTRPTSLTSGRTLGLQGHVSRFPGHGDYSDQGVNALYHISHGSDRLRTLLSLNGGYTWIDGQPWQLSLAVAAEASQPVWGPLWAGIAAQSNIGFAQSNGRANAVSDAVGLVVTAREHGRDHRFSSQFIQYHLSGSEDGHLQWRGLSNRYRLAWPLPYRLRSELNIRHDWRRFQADDRVFTEGPESSDRKRREDQFLSGEAALLWQAQTWLRSRTGFGFEWLDSNINAYGRDQWVVSQTLTLQF